MNNNLNQSSQKYDETLIDFDEDGVNKPHESIYKQVSLQNRNEYRIQDVSFAYRNKQLEIEKQQIKTQIDLMIKHLMQMKNMSEKKIENFNEPKTPLQRNMIYVKRFTYPRIQDLITQLDSFKNLQFPDNLPELYQLVEQSMGEFYKRYNSLYFDVKMFIERCRFYKNEDNERDTKIISQIINN